MEAIFVTDSKQKQEAEAKDIVDNLDFQDTNNIIKFLQESMSNNSENIDIEECNSLDLCKMNHNFFKFIEKQIAIRKLCSERIANEEIPDSDLIRHLIETQMQDLENSKTLIAESYKTIKLINLSRENLERKLNGTNF